MAKRNDFSQGSDNDLEPVNESRNPFKRIFNKRRKKTSELASNAIGDSKSVTDSGRRLPPMRDKGSILIAETKAMERSRRLAEQQGERRLAAVKARDHSLEESLQPSPEGELQNTILQHPELDSQRFDGIDPNLNPEPPLNSTARKEFDNERREQEKEKQLRLGNMPKFRTDPTPQGPR